MNDNARKWVKALRSKKYEQCTGYLKKDNGYCCMGVSCALYMKEKGGKWKKDKAGDYRFLNEPAYLPEKVKKWLGLNDDTGVYRDMDNGYEFGTSLTDKNDNGKTFDEIASIIESQPKGLFKEDN